MVTEDTIEEKVVERAQQKLKLDAMVVQRGLLQGEKKLEKDEMLAAVRCLLMVAAGILVLIGWLPCRRTTALHVFCVFWLWICTGHGWSMQCRPAMFSIKH